NRLDYGRIGGQILWNGKSLEEYDVHVLREQVAYIFQKAVMFPGSAEENIKMGAQFEHNVTQQELEGRFVKAIQEAGITPEMLSVEAADLSGGQQQRVGIARTLMLDPVVLLFDEPTASLDVETSNKFCKTLKVLKEHLKEKKSASLMITHRLEEASFLADKVLMLEEGKVVAFLPVNEFFNNPSNERVANFLKAYKL
ncbi:ABC transporter ATP-binding protein, partial [Turicimonas muris]